jgi:hypothetical protein
VVAVNVIADGAVQVFYKLPDGGFKERLLSTADEATIAAATTARPWAFDGDAAAFQLACEAKRIDLAFLFDPMMAVHTSNVEPLPHQITAVYESMLRRQPLRFVLADDPGAGKTIMAGLYIRELAKRADARRILIVAPGSLVEQWRDELFEKFGLEFRVFSSALEEATPSGNPFEDQQQLIVRLDQMSRNEELQAKLCVAGWDLVVFDEAHKLAAHYYGSKVEETGRFKFAKELGKETRHLLLMTATPHNGKEEDFQLFLSLLDSDRFYGKFRDGVHKLDPSDLMRRMVGSLRERQTSRLGEDEKTCISIDPKAHLGLTAGTSASRRLQTLVERSTGQRPSAGMLSSSDLLSVGSLDAADLPQVREWSREAIPRETSAGSPSHETDYHDRSRRGVLPLPKESVPPDGGRTEPRAARVCADDRRTGGGQQAGPEGDHRGCRGTPTWR